MPACCSSKKVSEPEVVAQTAPESKVIERNPTAEFPMPVQEPTRTQEAAEPEELNAQKDKVEESVKEEPSFEEWVANGKKIPEGLVFAGGSPWFEEKTGKNRSDREVFDLIFGGVTEGSDLKAEEGVKDEPSFEEWVANGKKIPEGLAFAGGSPSFDEKTGKNRSDREVFDLIFRGITGGSDTKVANGIKDEPSFEEWVANGKNIPGELVFAGGSPWFDEKTGKNRSDKEVYGLIFGGVTESDAIVENSIDDEQPVVPNGWFCCGSY